MHGSIEGHGGCEFRESDRNEAMLSPGERCDGSLQLSGVRLMQEFGDWPAEQTVGIKFKDSPDIGAHLPDLEVYFIKNEQDTIGLYLAEQVDRLAFAFAQINPGHAPPYCCIQAQRSDFGI